ncbi:MAG: aminoglycoside phosphotransferase family protein [Pseudomonadota bacterium]
MTMTQVQPPPALHALATQPGGDDWLQSLPTLLDQLLNQWQLAVAGPPLPGGSVSYVVPVTRNNTRFILKVQWPHEEMVHEADALREWNGNGAPKLIEHDQQRHGLLMEECIPGTFLADSDLEDPIGILTELLPKLWIQTNFRFRQLADEAAQWAAELPPSWERAGKPCERQLIDEALCYIDALSNSQGAQVLVHQDLHGHNIIAAEREPWLAIDPKPLVGEREFALAPIVRSFEFGGTPAATIGRLDRLSTELNLDRDRALGWTVAQTMAWGFGGSYDDRHHNTVRWLLDAR